MQDSGRIALVGTGLLGGSIGLALRAQGYQGVRVGIGRRQETVDQARELGCIDEGHTSLQDGLAGCDLIILATPIRTILEQLSEVSRHARPDAVVTDVGSTKAAIVEAVQRDLAHPQRFVGSHPMAGAERTGPQAARADLFRNKPCIITPAPGAAPGSGPGAGPGNGTDAAAVARVRKLWTDLGMKVQTMTPAAHDLAVARISHLPHALAALLVQLAARRGEIEMASTGFRDATRVASSDAELWADIFLTNQAAVAQALKDLCAQAEGFQEILRSGERAKLVTFLAASRSQRDNWIMGKTWAQEEG